MSIHAENNTQRPLPAATNVSHTYSSSADVQQSNARPRQSQPFSNGSADQPFITAAAAKGEHTQASEQHSRGYKSVAASATQPRQEAASRGDHANAPAAPDMQPSHEPVQFMSALSSLYGNTTPEQKRMREDKQKQYAYELDEQVGSVADAGPVTAQASAISVFMVSQCTFILYLVVCFLML